MKKRTPTEEELKAQARKISIQEGSAYGFMDGFGLKYLTPFALALGAKNTQIGILSSLPHLLGSFSELIGVKLMKNNTRKKLVSAGVMIQASMWLLMIALTIMFFVYDIDHGIAPNLLIVIYSLLIISGSTIAPAWASWMKDILPERFGTYFGRRNRICGTVAIVAGLVAGFILDYFDKTKLYYGFIILFAVAFLGRFISGLLFLKKYEPEYKNVSLKHDGFIHFLKTIWRTNYGHFTMFIALLSLVVNIASPFFAVYMIKNLSYTKIEFGIVIIAAAVSTILFNPAWGRFTDLYGNKKTMKITGFLIPFVALLWYLSSFLINSNPDLVFPYTVTVELFSGFAWAGFNLSAGNFIYEAVKREKVAAKTAYFHIINNLGGFIGALIGGIIATMSFVFLGISTILLVMILSFFGRFLVYALMVNKVKEVRKVKPFTVQEAKEKLLSLTPLTIVRILR